jgi:two-component system sensor histidine kinase ChvG
MTIEVGAGPLPPDAESRRSWIARLRAAWAMVANRLSSSLGRRIIVLNIAGLAALMLGYLWLIQFRADLIEPRIQSLLTQGEIIANAIASSTGGPRRDALVDPDRLLQELAGDPRLTAETEIEALDFRVNPALVAPLLRRLADIAKARARLYDERGFLVVDTRQFFSRGDFATTPEPKTEPEDRTIIARTWNLIRRSFGTTGIPLGEEQSSVDSRGLPEVSRALIGQSQSVVRINQRGQTSVFVAVPIRRLQKVHGVLLINTEGGDMDAVIAKERRAIVQIFLIAAAVMLVLSLLLANTVAGPMHKLADAAERVRRGVKSRVEIPDFTGRADEVGHLSGALRDMTQALYNRIEAIERFAADVAHELKNPLTSLRSAIETLPLARNDEARKRLMAIVQHDVRRLDRLISDISDASRLDAELARSEAEPVDVIRLAEAVIGLQNEIAKPGQARIELVVGARDRETGRLVVNGRDTRLGQVLTNLIDNARSFARENGRVAVRLRRDGGQIEIVVEDDGPGIPEHALERIFERFYTDRPHQSFGDHSGLGLSICRQIVEAHGGRIRAENRAPPADPEGPAREGTGARFVVRLPAADDKP